MVATLWLLAACAAADRTPDSPGLRGPAGAIPEAQRIEPPLHDQVSLIYGYIDMSDAPTELGWMEFRQVAPQTDTPYYQMRIYEGVFYMEKFPPGVFVLGEFGGKRWTGKHLAYTLPRNSPSVRVTIEAPGLYFVGAYKYRAVLENGQRMGRFELDRRDAPSDKEVLVRLLPFARGTDWEPRIQNQLNGNAK